MSQLVLGLPKGSLENATFEMMAKAGFNVSVSSRSYYPSVDDPELTARLLRPQDMSRYVERGVIDAGLTGQDWVAENGSDVLVAGTLVYAKQRAIPVRWVLAVPKDSPIQSVHDLSGKRIATELVNVTRDYLNERGVTADVEFSHGATEAKTPDLVDAIVELTETGTSLEQNNLRIIDTVMESVTQLIASQAAWADPWKRRKIENLAMLFEGAVIARDKVGLKMNVPKDALEAVLQELPALKRPTVSPLAGEDWLAIETILDEAVVREIVPELKRAGAQGIIEYPLNKVIP